MFILRTQKAGDDFNQYLDRSPVSLDDFLKELDTFPWMEQMEAYLEIGTGTSATLSAVNTESDVCLWVSIAGDSNKHTFLLGIVYMKTVKGFLGLGKEKVKKWLDIYEVAEMETIKEYFTWFFNQEEEEVMSRIRLERRFTSMEAAN